ncbi:MAG: hypothetical protein ILA34_02375 [Bacteroidaceae bacterium]|nr:hypothetical protein [Bacteroidaceae bacterium]
MADSFLADNGKVHVQPKALDLQHGAKAVLFAVQTPSVQGVKVERMRPEKFRARRERRVNKA